MPATETYWKSLYSTDQEFYELCERRVAEYAIIDPQGEHGWIYVDFGIREALLILNQIDDQAIQLFGSGACGYLAFELHRLTGLPLALFTYSESEWGWSGHAAVALPDGTFLDIEGVATAAEINSRYCFEEPIQATFPEEDAYCKTIFRTSGTGAQDPYAKLDPLEIRVLRHFAELTLEKSDARLPVAV